MSALVLNISKFAGQSVGSSAAYVVNKVNTPAKLNEIILLGLILTVIQILDGVMTGMGVALYGTEIEGNLFIRNLMDSIGYVQALTLVKVFGISVIYLLCNLAMTINWIPTALRGVMFVYLFAAIIPWTSILFFNA